MSFRRKGSTPPFRDAGSKQRLMTSGCFHSRSELLCDEFMTLVSFSLTSHLFFIIDTFCFSPFFALTVLCFVFSPPLCSSEQMAWIGLLSYPGSRFFFRFLFLII